MEGVKGKSIKMVWRERMYNNTLEVMEALKKCWFVSSHEIFYKDDNIIIRNDSGYFTGTEIKEVVGICEFYNRMFIVVMDENKIIIAYRMLVR